jgi:hypothetical protein
MKLSKVFTIAKAQLPRGRCKGICAVLYDLRQTGEVPRKDSYRAADIIGNRLDGSMYLGSWLEKHHYIYVGSNVRKYQATRLAWLDSLIAEFEAKGD